MRVRQVMPLLALLLTVPSASSASGLGPAPEPRRSGFVALLGAQAAAFEPDDALHPLWSQQYPDGWRQTRLQQRVGDVDVLGGQVTVWTDASGVQRAVIGNTFPRLTPRGPAAIRPETALAVARCTTDGWPHRWHPPAEGRRTDDTNGAIELTLDPAGDARVRMGGVVDYQVTDSCDGTWRDPDVWYQVPPCAAGGTPTDERSVGSWTSTPDGRITVTFACDEGPAIPGGPDRLWLRGTLTEVQ